MTNTKKQAALLKDLKKVLNDHGAEIQTRVLPNRVADLLLCFNNGDCAISIGDVITGEPVKDLEWYKERNEYLESELVKKDEQIETIGQANVRLGKGNHER